jgi:hypothetical protein
MKDANGKIVLPPGKLFMPAAKSFRRPANRLCRRRDRSAARLIVYTDDEIVLPPG